jgi:hypothetical protein
MTIKSLVDESACRRYERSWLEGRPQAIDQHVTAKESPAY